MNIFRFFQVPLCVYVCLCVCIWIYYGMLLWIVPRHFFHFYLIKNNIKKIIEKALHDMTYIQAWRQAVTAQSVVIYKRRPVVHGVMTSWRRLCSGGRLAEQETKPSLQHNPLSRELVVRREASWRGGGGGVTACTWLPSWVSTWMSRSCGLVQGTNFLERREERKERNPFCVFTFSV